VATGLHVRSRWLLLLFLVALLLRLGYFFVVHNGPLGNGDSLVYEDLAHKLLSHQPYATSMSAAPGGFPADLQRPPGYPVFLATVDALLGPTRLHTALVQSLLSAVFAVMLAVMVASFTVELTGLLAGFLYAIDWVTIVHVPMTIAETLLAVLMGAAICLCAISIVKERVRLAMAAGVLLGVAALTKPIAQVAVLAFLLGWFAKRKCRTTGLIFLLSFLACVAPWMIRNRQRHGLATLSAIGIVELYFYIGEASSHPEFVTDFSGSALNHEVTHLSNEWERRPLAVVERRRLMEQKALYLIAQNWPTVAYQSSVGLLRTCFGTGSITVTDSMPNRPGRMAQVLLAVLPLIEVLALWALAVLGAFRSNHASNIPLPIRLMLVACIALVIAPASATLGQSRYRVPAVPALAILGAAGGASLCDRWSISPHTK